MAANSRGTFGRTTATQITCDLPLPADPVVVDLSGNSVYAQLHLRTSAQARYSYGATETAAKASIVTVSPADQEWFVIDPGQIALPIVGNTGYVAIASNTGSAVTDGLSYDLIEDTDGGW